MKKLGYYMKELEEKEIEMEKKRWNELLFYGGMIM